MKPLLQAQATWAPLWRVAVVTTAEAEESVIELLEQVTGQTATAYQEAESREVVVSAYVTPAPDHRTSWRRALADGLRQIQACELAVGAARISIRKVRQEDWAESWKRHFKVIEIGSRLLIKPGWSRRRARSNQVEIILDPGLSFGTGQHPTTRFCLSELVERRRAGHPQSFLDIGTGSGILAIAAARLEYSPIRAFDWDAAAVRIAKENAARNGVDSRLHFHRQDLRKLSGHGWPRFDVICANVEFDVLLSESRKILERLRPGGFLVLAGIQRIQFARVEQAYAQHGCRRVATEVEQEWQSGTFQQGEPD